MRNLGNNFLSRFYYQVVHFELIYLLFKRYTEDIENFA